MLIDGMIDGVETKWSSSERHGVSSRLIRDDDKRQKIHLCLHSGVMRLTGEVAGIQARAQSRS